MYSRNNKTVRRPDGIVPPGYHGTAVSGKQYITPNRDAGGETAHHNPKVSVPSPPVSSQEEAYARHPLEVKIQPQDSRGNGWRSPFGNETNGVTHDLSGTAMIAASSEKDNEDAPKNECRADPLQLPVFSGIGNEEILLGAVLLLLLTGGEENREALLLVALLFIAGL